MVYLTYIRKKNLPNSRSREKATSKSFGKKSLFGSLNPIQILIYILNYDEKVWGW